jgi:hypothetical protein
MEEWKDIPGYEGIYEASTFGRIRTKEGKVTSNARYGRRVWNQRIMKSKISRRKNTDRFDERIILWKNNQSKTYLVSRVVAMTWVDGYHDGLTVNHIDGNPLNNHVSNLEWVSLAENIQKGFDDGLYSTCESCELVDHDGNSYHFRSRLECCEFLGRGKSYITNRVRRNQLDLPVTSVNGVDYHISLVWH